MLNFLHKKIILLAFCLTFLQAPLYAASNNTKLQKLITQIDQVKTDIGQKEKQQISIKQQLTNLKTKIKILEKDYIVTSKKLAYEKSVLAKLNETQNKQRLKLADAQKKITTQIVSAYKIKNDDYLPLLRQEKRTPNSSLLLMYHKYILLARLKQMQDISEILLRLEQNKQQTKEQTKILTALENKKQRQKMEVLQMEMERKNILEKLKTKITSQNKKLTQLILAKNNLEKLIFRLGSRTTIKVTPELMAKFCKNFTWPTAGTISVRFGCLIGESLKWNGVTILAPEKQKIFAASSGKVIYAGQFTGYGLLLIIDHGNGYMSLYGHNHSLYKRVNDYVLAGEVVATVGKDGDESELYFAIRYNGKPVDPERWCGR